jgi:hypothetical protein
MSQKTKWVIGVIVIIALVVVGYFVSKKGPVSPVSKETVKIGVIFPSPAVQPA